MLKHEKRYMVILEVWNGKDCYHIKPSVSMDQYDNMNEVNQAVDMILEMYGKAKKPVKWDINSHYWGYVILDFQEEKILAVGHDGLHAYHEINDNTYKQLKMMDDFFRKDDEIPDDYQWADGEYAGWLQFRWGDKKNAVKYTKAGDKLPISASELTFGTAKVIHGINVKIKKACKKHLPKLITEDE